MTDIVERLRKYHKAWADDPHGVGKSFSEAADEIERLREALLEIAEFNSTGGDAAYMMDLARRALGEAKDE